MKLLTSDVGWVSTDRKLFWTTNGGAQWDDITPKLGHKEQQVSSVFFLDVSTGWVLLSCDDDRDPIADDICFEFAFTTNAGQSWAVARPRLIDPATQSAVKDGQGFSGVTFLSFADSQHGWAIFKRSLPVGRSSGVMLRTSDGGRTWTQLPKDTLPMAEPFRFATARDGWLAGGPDQELYVTHDAGTSWQIVELKAPQRISTDLSPVYDLPTLLDDAHGYLPVTYESSTSSGTPVVLFQTRDGGKTWQASATAESLPDAHPWTPFPSAVVNGELLAATVSAGRVNLFRIGKGTEPTSQAATISVKASGADQLSFVNTQCGWLLAGRRLLTTSDGGAGWIDVTPVGAAPANTSSFGGSSKISAGREAASFSPTGLEPLPAATGSSSTHLGFDTFPTQPTATMQAWWNSSPFYDVYIYLYGSPNKSTTKSKYATKSWLSTVEGYGWGVIPIWFGLQSSCVNDKTGITQFISTTPATASTQGAQQADLAVAADQALGITGGIIYVDIESYTVDHSTCSLAVQAYVDGLVSEMHTYSGYVVGVYANPAPINSDIHNTDVAQPDAIWITKVPPKGSTTPAVTIWNQAISDNFWPNDQRMHQFLFNQSTTFGSVGSVNIDPDIDNGPVLNANNGAKTYSSYTFESLDYPGSILTWAQGANDTWDGALINSSGLVGQIAGFFWDSGGKAHGFLLDGLVAWTQIDYPGALNTWADAINNSGLVVGIWEDSTGNDHGFTYNSSSGAFTTFDYPGATTTQAWGVNDAGQIVGWYYDAAGNEHGFLHYGSKFYSIDYPGTAGVTEAFGINGDGVTSGAYIGSGIHNSFVQYPVPPTWTGNFTSFSRAGAIGTWGYAIDNDNDLVGTYELSQSNLYAFDLTNNVILNYFQYPASTITYAQGTNDFGQIVGSYQDSNQKYHMFVALPQP